MEGGAVEGFSQDLSDGKAVLELRDNEVETFTYERYETQAEDSGCCASSDAIIRLSRVNMPSGRNVAVGDAIIALDLCCIDAHPA